MKITFSREINKRRRGRGKVRGVIFCQKIIKTSPHPRLFGGREYLTNMNSRGIASESTFRWGNSNIPHICWIFSPVYLRFVIVITLWCLALVWHGKSTYNKLLVKRSKHV